MDGAMITRMLHVSLKFDEVWAEWAETAGWMHEESPCFDLSRIGQCRKNTPRSLSHFSQIQNIEDLKANIAIVEAALSSLDEITVTSFISFIQG